MDDFEVEVIRVAQLITFINSELRASASRFSVRLFFFKMSIFESPAIIAGELYWEIDERKSFNKEIETFALA